MTLVRTTDAAKLLGVSRQAVEQAMARNAAPPEVREKVGASRLYDLDEIMAWWKRRTETAVREHRMRAAGQPTAQCNIRMTSDDYAFMDSLRRPGETIAAIGRMLLQEAIAARKAGGDLG
jgi:predicted DNA-binding transcriptional regulator AlpA